MADAEVAALFEWLASTRGTLPPLVLDAALATAAQAQADALIDAADAGDVAAVGAGGARAFLERLGVAQSCTTLVFTGAFTAPAAAAEGKDGDEDEAKRDEADHDASARDAEASPSAALLPLARAGATCSAIAAALRETASHAGVGCAFASSSGRLAVVLHLAEYRAQVTDIDGSSDRGASSVLTLPSASLLMPGRPRVVRLKVLPDAGLEVSSYRVRCDMHEGEASTVAPVEVSVVAGVNAPFSGASASVLTRAAAAAASRLTDAIIVLGDDVRRDDDGCYELELPLSKLYAAPNFCTHRYVVDAFVYEADSPVADGPESGASASSAADPDATPAASPIEGAVKVGRELHACRFVLHVAGHDREAREEAHVASLLPSSIHVGAFNELAVAVGSGAEAALPAGFSSLGMPLHVLSTDVRRLPLIAGGVFHAGSGLPPISHVLLISGESAEACLANCPQGYETLPVNLAHDVARILGALPLHVIYEVSHSTSRDDESSAHVAPTAAALDGETAAEGGGAGVVEAEVAAVPAEPVAVDGSESKAVEAAEGALADSDEAATSGANAAAAELPPPADVPETSADHARSSDSVVLAPVELDVFPAFVFVAVLREAHGGQGAGATACQHLVLAAVASLPGVPVHAPPVATPDGYALQLVDLGLRTRARPQDVRGEDDDGTERRLVRLVLAQTSDPHAATRTADAGEGLTVGEYDADTLRELAAAEEAALAASSAEEYAADRDELLEMLRTALAENDSLMQRNFGVQHAISSLFFARLSHEEQAKAVEAASKQAASQLASGGALAHFTTAEQTKKYNLLLDAIAVERAHVAEEDERFGGRALALQQRLDDKDARLGQVAGALADFKLEVAKSSVDGQSGKPMPRDLIAQYERRDAEKAADVGRLQLKNLFLQGQIAKLEAQLAKREQLADGLALIDFEQLKIENSTLVEKIDDRNEELAKLRKKTTTAVQTLTHIREKLHFVTADVTRLQADLLTIERAVSEQRASLGIGKKARERTRAETEKARNTQGFAYNDRLAIDFERRKDTVLVLKGELAQRVREFESLCLRALA